jgi:hypothetical protein
MKYQKLFQFLSLRKRKEISRQSFSVKWENALIMGFDKKTISIEYLSSVFVMADRIPRI